MWVAPTLKIDILAQSPHCQASETPTVRPQPQPGATGFSHPLGKSQLEVDVHSAWNLLLRCPQTHSKQSARRRARKKEANQCQALCGSEMEPLAPTRPRSGDAGPLPQHGNSRWEKKIEKQNVYLL